MDMADKLYSLVIPLYNEEESVAECIRRVVPVMQSLNGDYEILLINDGSTDATESLVKGMCRDNPRLKLLSFSRNFGHQTAITAGMDHACGDAVIVIDADLQDPPEVIPQMVDMFLQGYDVVYGIREKREGETFFKKVSAKIFYRFLRYMCPMNIPVDTGDFRLLSRRVVDVMKAMTERNRYVRGLVAWVGFSQTGVEYIREKRFAGKTKYPLKKMLKLSVDGVTSFSTKPLKMSQNVGLAMAFLGFLYAVYVVILRLTGGQVQTGWASITVLILIVGGIQLMMLGVMGEYIARIFDESKNRPLYVIRETVNMEKKS